ncbi:protocadherin-8-like isoform 2-T3 [Hipposideros larvatus]
MSLVPEGAARESLVALVSTSDRDSGANAQVRCALHGHEHFRLQPAYAGSYLVVTAASLDRERIAEYNLTLVAEDRGAPPLRTVRPYTVRVGDENHNAPLFTRPVYEVSVRENNPPGAYLATVAARDPDLGRNGQVTYRLLEAEGSASVPFHSPFRHGKDKSAASLSMHSNPDEFGVKDGGEGDSEVNDSSSDTSDCKARGEC